MRLISERGGKPVTEEKQGTFEVKSWDEKPAQELQDGAKITRAAVTQSYSGIISGNGSVEYVMFHRGDGTAVFSGVEHIACTDGIINFSRQSGLAVCFVSDAGITAIFAEFYDDCLNPLFQDFLCSIFR